jgi:hypothetical protein
MGCRIHRPRTIRRAATEWSIASPRRLRCSVADRWMLAFQGMIISLRCESGWAEGDDARCAGICRLR